jgi:threonine/homoserine/homoserine lactone efflux protein
VTTALLGFALAATVVILAPGPDFMLVMRNTMRGGRRGFGVIDRALAGRWLA